MINENTLLAMDIAAQQELDGDDLMQHLEITRLARLGLWAEKWAIKPIKHYAKFLARKLNLEKNQLQRAVDELNKIPDSTEH